MQSPLSSNCCCYPPANSQSFEHIKTHPFQNRGRFRAKTFLHPQYNRDNTAFNCEDNSKVDRNPNFSRKHANLRHKLVRPIPECSTDHLSSFFSSSIKYRSKLLNIIICWSSAKLQRRISSYISASRHFSNSSMVRIWKKKQVALADVREWGACICTQRMPYF